MASTHERLYGAPGSGRRDAVNAWLLANNVSPKDVCAESDILLQGDGQTEPRTIVFTVLVRDSDGNIRITDDRTAMREQRTVPCDHEPPAWLDLPGST